MLLPIVADVKATEFLNKNYTIKIMNIHIFCSPEEAMLENWWKHDFNTKYFLFWEKSEPSSN